MSQLCVKSHTSLHSEKVGVATVLAAPVEGVNRSIGLASKFSLRCNLHLEYGGVASMLGNTAPAWLLACPAALL